VMNDAPSGSRGNALPDEGLQPEDGSRGKLVCYVRGREAIARAHINVRIYRRVEGILQSI